MTGHKYLKNYVVHLQDVQCGILKFSTLWRDRMEMYAGMIGRKWTRMEANKKNKGFVGWSGVSELGNYLASDFTYSFSTRIT